MSREAALSARLSLNDSDFRKKVRAQKDTYNDLLRENQRFKDRLAQQNNAARQRELAADSAHFKSMVKQSRDANLARMATWGRPQSPVMPEPVMQRARLSGQGQWDHLIGNTRALTAANDRLQRSSGRAAMSILELQRMIEDFTMAGMRGAINNMAPLMMSLTGSAKAAGVAGLGMLAVDFALGQRQKFEKNWGEMSEDDRLAHNDEVKKLRAAGDERQHRIEMRAAQEYIQALDDRTQREEDGRQAMIRSAAAAETRAEAEQEILKAKNARLQGSAAIEAENARAFKAEEESLQRRIRLMDSLMALDRDPRARIGQAIMDMEREKTALVATRQRTQVGSNSRGEGVFDMLASPVDENRIQVLEAQIAGARARANALDRRGAGYAQQKDEALQTITGEMPLRRQAAEEELKQAIEEEGKENRRKLVEFVGILKNIGQGVRDWGREVAQRTEHGKARRESITGSLKVAELRMAGKDKQADALAKQNFITERSAALEKEGFKPGEAADIAAREHDVQHPQKKRPGTIKGAVAKNLRTGLDGEFHGGPTDFDAFFKDPDLFGLKEAATQKRMPLNKRLGELNKDIGTAKSAGNEATVTELKALKDAVIRKLDELNSSMKGSVGEQTKPATVAGGS